MLPPQPTSRRDRWRQLQPLRSHEESAPLTASQQLLVGVAGAVAVLALAALVLAGADGPAAVWCWICLQLLPGAALCVWVPSLTRVGFALYTVVGSAVFNILVGLVMARGGWWEPVPVQALTVAVCFVSFVAVSSRLAGRGARLGRLARERGVTPVAVVSMVCAAGIALVAAGTPSGVTAPRAGLIGVVGPAWWAGMACLVVAFGYAVWRRSGMALPVLTASIIVVLAQAIAYRTPVVTAAAGHIGVIEFITTGGRADPNLDIYQAWVGFFGAQAWTGSGIGDWFQLATWWPIFGSLAEVLAVRVLAGKFVDTRRAWLAAGLFTLADSLNIAYFSPQTYVFAPALTIPILLLHGPESRARATARWIALAGVSVAVIVSHQLTPYMLVCLLAVLVVGRAIRPWWTPLALFGVAVVWALLNRSVLGNYVSLSTFGDVFSNLSPPDHGTPVLPPQRVTDLTFEVPSFGVLLIGIGALVALVRWRHSREAWLLVAAAMSPAGVAAATDYGAEGIFRVVLFALPWLSILAVTATVRVGAPTGGHAATRSVRVATVSVVAAMTGAAVLLAINVLGQSAMDWARAMRPGTIEVAGYFERNAAPNAVLFSSGTGRVTPGRQSARYADFQYLSRDDLAGKGVNGFATTTGSAYDPQADIRAWTDKLLTVSARGHYVIFSVEIGAAGERYRNQSYVDYRRMWAAMADAPGWQLVDRSDSAALYRWVG
ncbi:hypothetical protein HJ588_04595 [Flexivirga sp. ID2601S]|uniref:Glycosyltransferase RgtA/B/C/D-like domain-containing protein n=1 Tax=Flexivirga aerilata TaxID=1656889 RepID=A0A849ADH4_9MICO|nr:hypothetical protein [Flexivirga aerilata]NNG38555.1 hypothetical protein [Flexivirga aerilata]